MKRILTLDGGGIRGVFSLQVLARVEELFRRERNKPDLVLREEFDFFAGTSTGAIIATFLAWGMSVKDILHLYKKDSREMFNPAALMSRIIKNKYNADTISNYFKGQFVEADGRPALLGTRKLYDGGQPKYLLVVMRNASSGSAWPVSNNPLARYNLASEPECNLQIPLWQLLRASTAAPTFFPPERIILNRQTGREQIFVDGGITPYNNPALIAVLMATLPSYKINWATGPEKIHLLSIGTGQTRVRMEKVDPATINKIDQILHVVPALLHGIGMEQDLLCRVLGRCVHGEYDDSEVGNLVGEAGLLGQDEKKFTYARYNMNFPDNEVAEQIRSTDQAFALDNLKLIPYLEKSGQDYAAKNVKREHLFPTAG